MSTDLHLPCPCGQSIAVTPGQAGTNVRCICGTTLPVPRLAELRRMAGKDPYATNPAERIRKLEAAGRMTLGDQCVGCHAFTDGVLSADIICERAYVEVESKSSWQDRIFLVFSPILYFFVRLFAPRETGEVKVLGRDVEVIARLRVCPACRPSSSLFTSRETLVAWLRTVPLYAELLDMYPEATIEPRV